LPVTTGCRWIGILRHVFDRRFTGAHIQSDNAYLSTKTVSFWGQVEIKQINRSSILILYALSNYYTENHI